MSRIVHIKEWDLKLGNRIIAATLKNGFLSCITKGERGYGKTAYDIKNAAYVGYKIHGYTNDDDAYQYALDNIIFTADELLRRVDYNIRNTEISPVIIIDDATVHFSSYMFFINVFQTALMNATFDTIRTITRSVLLNCPNKKRLLKALQYYDDYEITIYKEIPGGYERKAVAIKWYSLPDGHRRFRKDFEDYFSCYLPDWVYEKYLEQRHIHMQDINEQLTTLRKKLDKHKSKMSLLVKAEDDSYEA